MKKVLCILLTLLLLCGSVPAVWAAAYQVSSTTLSTGANAVKTIDASLATLYVFKPEKAGFYEISVDSASAVLSYWHGSKHYVTGLSEEVVGGILTVECSSVGQAFLIGLAGVNAATITIVEREGYVPPEAMVYEPYENVHTPVSDFAMPEEELTRVDIMKPQTVVADADGIYHLNTADGPILYVNMCAATYADLYACYHPTSGSGALNLRGRYTDEAGKERGYEFLEAMRPYAEALDADGYYYLTVDLATYIRTYGENQGWFSRTNSPFTQIRQGKYIEESAWLVNVYYVDVPEEAVVGGDANGDGKVNNRDLGLLQQYLNGWDVTIDATACDINGDGKVNNRDLGLLQQQLNT